MQTVTREINCIPNIKNNLTEGDGWIGGAGGDVTLSLEMGEISKTTGVISFMVLVNNPDTAIYIHWIGTITAMDGTCITIGVGVYNKGGICVVMDLRY